MKKVTTTTARLIRNEATALASSSWSRLIGRLRRMAIVRSERSPAISSEASHPKMRIRRNMTIPPRAKSAASVIENDCSGAMLLSMRYWSSAIACCSRLISSSMLKPPRKPPDGCVCLICCSCVIDCWLVAISWRNVVCHATAGGGAGVLGDRGVRVQAAGDEQEDPSHHREHDPAAAPGLHQLDPDQVDEGHHGVSAPEGIDGGGAGGGGGGGGGGGPLSGLPGATPVSSMYTSSRPRCVRTSWSTPMPATTSAWLIVRARSLGELTMIESLMVPGSTVAPSIDLTISIALSASDTSMR